QINGFGLGTQWFYGGAGNDTIDYSAIHTNLTIRIGIGAQGSDYVSADIDNVIGGSGNDRVVGSDLPNKLVGGPGNDTLIGNGGLDTLDGGAGTDSAPSPGGDMLISIESSADTGDIYIDSDHVVNVGGTAGADLIFISRNGA